ncbi:ornithine decarboxylase [Thioclava dalianensis]|uniref:ornithine decarboxylase n=1 Tax=Thioclava dalianensis TaxID=1185766 RepID=A0A074TH84_9RHOB|nr:ornithine decarboxylase [Thioclava dalianensis]KEP69515.1 ornithine decarboxylase [Thioclava dalianensis]SFN67447.1 ornithine decarboxylase [Thioclava dalianensis]
MELSDPIWASPREIIRARRPQHPISVFAPSALQATAQHFLHGFPGLVTYAVKANPEPMVIENLVAAGITGFDVASPAEIALIRSLAPGSALHYHNPVRSRDEIACAIAAEVTSWSVDSQSELDKLRAQGLVPGSEIAVRFKLPVAGAAYDFGSKFGATEAQAVQLLAQAAALGFRPSLTFHPGTQCTDPAAWDTYIRAAASIARAAGVTLARLNLGGGFPSHRAQGPAPALDEIFARIDQAVETAFGAARPALVCEPGRGLVADSVTHIACVKALRDGRDVFLNDGVYGALTELPQIGLLERIEVIAPDGRPRRAPAYPRVVFGPTCDSLDRLPGEMALPGDLAEGDYILFHGLGAYSGVTNTRFNGFGQLETLTAMRLTD